MKYFLFKILIISLLCISSFSQKKNTPASVTVELTKTNYKVFEPIDVLIGYKNTGSETDSVYRLNFISFYGFLSCNLKDEKGNYYNKCEVNDGLLGILIKPDYSLNPGDSVLFAHQINTWGKKTENRDSVYFDNNYFPPGKYKGYFHWNYVYGKGMKLPPITNEFSFTVSEIDSNDFAMLNKVKGKKFDELKEFFPNNYFQEYIIREKIRFILMGRNHKIRPKQGLINTFYEYFNAFPNSYYNINYLGQFINLISKKDEDDIEKNILKMRKLYKNTLIDKFLGNEVEAKYITKNIMNSRYAE